MASAGVALIAERRLANAIRKSPAAGVKEVGAAVTSAERVTVGAASVPPTAMMVTLYQLELVSSIAACGAPSAVLGTETSMKATCMPTRR